MSNSATPWTVACPPGSSVHGISQQEYWSGLPFPSPGDLLNPGIEPVSPALQMDSLYMSHRGSLRILYLYMCVHTHTHIYIHIHVHIYIHTHICTHICTHIHTYAPTHTLTHTHRSFLSRMCPVSSKVCLYVLICKQKNVRKRLQ